jgi:hypothetical protein
VDDGDGAAEPAARELTVVDEAAGASEPGLGEQVETFVQATLGGCPYRGCPYRGWDAPTEVCWMTRIVAGESGQHGDPETTGAVADGERDVPTGCIDLAEQQVGAAIVCVAMVSAGTC